MIVYISRQLIINEGKMSKYFYQRIIIATVLLFLFLIFEICILIDKFFLYTLLSDFILRQFISNDWLYFYYYDKYSQAFLLITTAVALLILVLEHALIYILLIRKKRGQCINIIFVAIYFLPPIIYEIFSLSLNGYPLVYGFIKGIF